MSIYLADWTSKYFEKYSREYSEKYSENILEQGPLAPDTNTCTQKANAQLAVLQIVYSEASSWRRRKHSVKPFSPLALPLLSASYNI